MWGRRRIHNSQTVNDCVLLLPVFKEETGIIKSLTKACVRVCLPLPHINRVVFMRKNTEKNNKKSQFNLA